MIKLNFFMKYHILFLLSTFAFHITLLSDTSERLEWNFSIRREETKLGDYYNYHLDKMNYYIDEQKIWTYKLPDWIQARAREQSFKEVVDIKNYHGYPFLIGSFIENEIIIVADIAGILILNKSTGKKVLEKKLESQKDFFFIDSGQVRISKGSIFCEEKIKGSKFIIKCANEFFYFNGSHLLHFLENGRILEEKIYNPELYPNLSKRFPVYEILIPLKNFLVLINGVVYMK